MSGDSNTPEINWKLFHSKIQAEDSGCWTWTGVKNHRGYGRFHSQGPSPVKLHRAHRLSYQFYNGPIPEGMYVCHRCDNPSCVNPAHLFIGSDADNVADRTAKGRAANGEANGRCKLSDHDVESIRSAFLSGMRQAQLGRSFGVSRQCIHQLVTGKYRTDAQTRPDGYTEACPII